MDNCEVGCHDPKARLEVDGGELAHRLLDETHGKGRLRGDLACEAERLIFDVLVVVDVVNEPESQRLVG